MGHGFSIVLEPIWREWDEPIFRLVAELHRGLPPSIPPVTLHGRDLEPVAEGFGAQYQLTMNGHLYGGRYGAAYFIIQIMPQRQPPPPAERGAGTVARLVWQVDTVTVLQPARPGAEIERFAGRRDVVPIAEPERLRSLFRGSLAEAGAAFVRDVLAGARPGA